MGFDTGSSFDKMQSHPNPKQNQLWQQVEISQLYSNIHLKFAKVSYSSYQNK